MDIFMRTLVKADSWLNYRYKVSGTKQKAKLFINLTPVVPLIRNSIQKPEREA